MGHGPLNSILGSYLMPGMDFFPKTRLFILKYIRKSTQRDRNRGEYLHKNKTRKEVREQRKNNYFILVAEKFPWCNLCVVPSLVFVSVSRSQGVFVRPDLFMWKRELLFSQGWKKADLQIPICILFLWFSEWEKGLILPIIIRTLSSGHSKKGQFLTF